MNADGTGFSGYTLFAVGTAGSPAIAWNSTTNKLQYAIRDVANNAWVGSINYNGTTFSSPTQVTLAGSTIGSAPAIAIATSGTPGMVYVAAKNGTSTSIKVGSITSDLATFSGWKTWPTGTVNTAMGAAWNGTTSRLELVEKGSASNNVFKASANATLSSFTGWTQVTGAVSTDVPAAGMDPLLPPLNIFSLNAGNVAGYLTAAP
jgi:hypothetical protein